MFWTLQDETFAKIKKDITIVCKISEFENTKLED